jgi:hypothetical protein
MLFGGAAVVVAGVRSFPSWRGTVASHPIPSRIHEADEKGVIYWVGSGTFYAYNGFVVTEYTER